MQVLHFENLTYRVPGPLDLILEALGCSWQKVADTDMALRSPRLDLEHALTVGARLDPNVVTLSVSLDLQSTENNVLHPTRIGLKAILLVNHKDVMELPGCESTRTFYMLSFTAHTAMQLKSNPKAPNLRAANR